MENRPLKQTERIAVVDAIRGFALFGILMVNMLIMYEPVSRLLLGTNPNLPVSEFISESFIRLFFEGKFYVIFSMLFGFGFWVFLNKVDDMKAVLPTFRRRLFFLLLFGIAHITLLWAGDILFIYALLGFILLLFRKSSDKKVRRWMVTMVIFPIALNALLLFFAFLASMTPEGQAAFDEQIHESTSKTMELVERASKAYSTGTFAEIVQVRVEEYLKMLGGSIFFFVPGVLAMFLLGFLAARKGFIQNYREKYAFYVKLLRWTLPVGLITSVLYVIATKYSARTVPDGWTLLSAAMHIIGGITLGLAYISVIIILFIKGKSAFFERYFVPVGRMALTNYLMQSLITALLFHSYGLSLFGKVEVWQGIILTVIIFTLQIFFSRWWLKKYQYGPAEWLWRSLTYLKKQPMKRSL